MYPLSIVLVGCDTNTILALSNLQHQYPTYLEAEFPNDSGPRAAWTNDPRAARLLLVAVRSIGQIGQVERLHGHFTDWPVVAMVDGGVDLMIRAITAGAFQVLPLPPRAENFLAVMDAVAEVYARGRDRVSSSMVVVCGVHRDVGATSIALQLAKGLARDPRRLCLLVELAFGTGSLAKYLQRTDVPTLADCLFRPRPPDELDVREVVVRVDDNLDVLLAPPQVPALASERVIALTKCLPRLARTIILDLPFTNDPYFFQILENADRILFVGTQQIASVRALRILRRLVDIHGSVPGEDYAMVFNRFHPQKSGFEIPNIHTLLSVDNVFTLPDYSPPPSRWQFVPKPEMAPILQWIDRDAKSSLDAMGTEWRWLFRTCGTTPPDSAATPTPP